MADVALTYTTALRRLPSLDGIRGIAILLVMASHAEMAGAAMPREWIVRLGDFGVKLFFVLSGFLITALLLQEQARTGRIAYARFLLRRAFRILPASYAFILSVIAASALGLITLRPGDALHALTYTADIGMRSWWVGHLWSLSIEEQYYLVWPLVLGFIRHRLGASLMFGTMIVAALGRGVVLTWYPALAEGIDRSFIAAIDGFAAGGLLATLQQQLEGCEWYSRMLRAPWVPALLILAGFLDQLERHPLVFYVVLQSVIYGLLAIWLHRSQVVTSDRLTRILNSRMLSWMGVISYSLYLWQQPFLAPADSRLVQSLPAAVALSLLFAVLSYQLVERPFLRLRERVVSS